MRKACKKIAGLQVRDFRFAGLDLSHVFLFFLPEKHMQEA